MNYTAKDIWAARDYKKLGYNWVARDKDGEVAVFQDKPDKGSEGWMLEHLWSHSKWEIIPRYLFSSTTWEDSEPTNLDDIIASEKGFLKYERLTTSKSWYELDIDEEYNCDYLWQRLQELEDKIESGELVFRGDDEKIY